MAELWAWKRSHLFCGLSLLASKAVHHVGQTAPAGVFVIFSILVVLLVVTLSGGKVLIEMVFNFLNVLVMVRSHGAVLVMGVRQVLAAADVMRVYSMNASVRMRLRLAWMRLGDVLGHVLRACWPMQFLFPMLRAYFLDAMSRFAACF